VNAGWLLAQGRPIYTDNETYPYFSSNYPPVYSLAVALATRIWGPLLLAGRTVSLIATLGLAVLIFLVARERSNVLGGLTAAGVFWLSDYVFHFTPLARVNALTGFLALAGLLCIGRAGRVWVAAGAALLLAALYTKPTAVDAVIAALFKLWLENRRVCLMVGTGLAAATLLLGALLELSTARAFSLNVLLGNVNPFLPEQLRDYFANFALLHAAPLGLATYSIAQSARARRIDGVQLFFLAGLAVALGVGKWGAGESYFLSAIVGSCILAGQVAGRLFERGRAPALTVPVLFLAQSMISAHDPISTRLPGLADRGLQSAALASVPTYGDLERGHAIVTRLRAQPGPGLAEDPAFELGAGKEVVGNATHLRNLYQAGLWRPDNLVADVVARRYHTVVLDAELYPEPVLAAIGRHYFLYETVVVHRATQQIFLPGAS
jgi:hypothetical protein